MKALAELKPNTDHLKRLQQDYLLHSTLFYELNNPDKVDVNKSIARFDRSIHRIKKFLHPVPHAHHLFNMAVLMHRHSSFANSRHYFNQFLKIAKDQASLHDLHLTGMLLQWTNFYSLNETEHADKLLRNLLYFYKQRNLKDEFLETVIQEFGKAQKKGTSALKRLSLNAGEVAPTRQQLAGLLHDWLQKLK